MIKVIKVKDKAQGNKKAGEILAKIVDKKTLLALSGGTTPDYSEMIVKRGDVLPGAAFVVDERWTDDDESTNVEMMKKDGLGKVFKKKKIDFYGVPCKCETDNKVEDVVEGFDYLLAELFEKFPKKIGVMGVGANSHTAGVFPKSIAAESLDLAVYDKVDDKYPERITTTLKALGEFDAFVILAFGEEKREALENMLHGKKGDVSKYPDIFYNFAKAESYLITDIDVK